MTKQNITEVVTNFLHWIRICNIGLKTEKHMLQKTISQFTLTLSSGETCRNKKNTIWLV